MGESELFYILANIMAFVIFSNYVIINFIKRIEGNKTWAKYLEFNKDIGLEVVEQNSSSLTELLANSKRSFNERLNSLSYTFLLKFPEILKNLNDYKSVKIRIKTKDGSIVDIYCIQDLGIQVIVMNTIENGKGNIFMPQVYQGYLGLRVYIKAYKRVRNMIMEKIDPTLETYIVANNSACGIGIYLLNDLRSIIPSTKACFTNPPRVLSWASSAEYNFKHANNFVALKIKGDRVKSVPYLSFYSFPIKPTLIDIGKNNIKSTDSLEYDIPRKYGGLITNPDFAKKYIDRVIREERRKKPRD